MSKVNPFLVIIFLSVAVFALGVRMTGGNRVKDPKVVLKEINALFIRSPNLDLAVTDCQPLFPSTSEYRRCFVSHSDGYALPKNLAEVLAPIAFTLGWSDDANVPGAFYALNNDHKQTFSITVAPVQETDRLKKIPALKKFANFVTLRVDENSEQR